MPLAPNPPASSTQGQLIVPMSLEEEDAIIHARHQNDDKALRRVIKKFHTLNRLNSAAGASGNTLSDKPTENESTEEARAAFLLELSSYELALRRTTLVCEAEARQVAEYESEKRRIAHEHENLLGQISQLKTSLEHAQVDRRRKIEYDVLAEKINALPTRDELSLTIEALESDMAAIRLEQETQELTLRAQKDAMHAVLDSISALRRMGKEEESGEGDTGDGDGTDEAGRAGTEEGEEREARASPILILNPTAKPFVPPTAAGRLQAATASHSPSRTSTPLNGRGTPSQISRPAAKEDDIEMGEVSEVRRKRKPKEDLEEGEASDGSSESGEAGEDS